MLFLLQDDSESSDQQHAATDTEGLSEATRQRRGRLLDRVEHKTEVDIWTIHVYVCTSDDGSLFTCLGTH